MGRGGNDAPLPRKDARNKARTNRIEGGLVLCVHARDEKGHTAPGKPAKHVCSDIVSTDLAVIAGRMGS